MKTLSDIAREMGVSKSTVSYIYHDKWRQKRISAELAERVLEKLRQEHAQPSMLGTQLRSGLTQTAGLLLPNLDQPYFLQLLAGLERRLGQENCMLFLGNVHRGAVLRQNEFLEAMMARSVDRVILSPVPAEGLLQLLTGMRAREIPVICVNNYLPNTEFPFVVTDNVYGATRLIREVIATGRKRILFLGASPRVAVIADRLAGYKAALAEPGLKPPRNGILWREQLGEKFEDAVRTHLTSRSRPDAIFFDSLFLSRRIILMMHELGLKHPDDIMVCGFDYPVDLPRTDAFYETVLTPLLTVQQDARRMGMYAAELALHGRLEATGESFVLLKPAFSWEELLPGPVSGNRILSPMAQ